MLLFQFPSGHIVTEMAKLRKATFQKTVIDLESATYDDEALMEQDMTVNNLTTKFVGLDGSTPVKTPTVTMENTPVKTPVKTPAKTPAKTTMKTPLKTPLKTPAETTVKSPAKTPIDSKSTYSGKYVVSII